MEKALGMKFPLTAHSFTPYIVGLINGVGGLRMEYRWESDSDVLKRAHHQTQLSPSAAGESKMFKFACHMHAFPGRDIFMLDLRALHMDTSIVERGQKHCQGAYHFADDIHLWATCLYHVSKGQTLFPIARLWRRPGSHEKHGLLFSAKRELTQ